jgi:hypothetical protein
VAISPKRSFPFYLVTGPSLSNAYAPASLFARVPTLSDHTAARIRRRRRPRVHSKRRGRMAATRPLQLACGPAIHTVPSRTSNRPSTSRWNPSRAPLPLVEVLEAAPGAHEVRPLPAPADGSAATALQSRISNNSSRAQPSQSWISQKDQQQQLEQQRQPRALAAAPLASSLTQLGVRLNEPPSKPPQQEERDKEFFANVGDAIRSLREDYPLLFVKDLNCETHCPPACVPARPACADGSKLNPAYQPTRPASTLCASSASSTLSLLSLLAL